MKLCKNCKYGGVSPWGYMECWKFNRRMDMRTTANTAVREWHALSYNKYYDCVHYKKLTFKKRVCYSILKLGIGVKVFLKRLMRLY